MRKQLKLIKITIQVSALTLVAILMGGLLSTTLVDADSTASTSSTTTCTNTTNNQTRLQVIISKGDQEIERRLTTLNTLSAKISAATHLTANDQAILSGEVTSTNSGLQTLKTQLDSETTICAARTDVANIYSEYRVYALVAPKVELVKVADDQQVVESKLSTLAQKLQSRITADSQAGKNVASLQTLLNNMTSQTTSAQQVSANIENGVINLQPSDYNANHSILEGDNTQLQTAHSDNQTAYNDAKQIVAGLKSLS